MVNVNAITFVLPIAVGVVAGVLTGRFTRQPVRSRTLRIAVAVGAAYVVVVSVVILITAWRMK
jgi:CHASE2 domain-containing sensor protein